MEKNSFKILCHKMIFESSIKIRISLLNQIKFYPIFYIYFIIYLIYYIIYLINYLFNSPNKKFVTCSNSAAACYSSLSLNNGSDSTQHGLYKFMNISIIHHYSPIHASTICIVQSSCVDAV